MKVLFEVERFNDPDINSKLLDVLFSIKADLIIRLQPLMNEIDAVDGEMVIVFTPDAVGFRAIAMEMDLILKIEKITDNIKVHDIIQNIVSINVQI